MFIKEDKIRAKIAEFEEKIKKLKGLLEINQEFPELFEPRGVEFESENQVPGSPQEIRVPSIPSTVNSQEDAFYEAAKLLVSPFTFKRLFEEVEEHFPDYATEPDIVRQYLYRKSRPEDEKALFEMVYHGRGRRPSTYKLKR